MTGAVPSRLPSLGHVKGEVECSAFFDSTFGPHFSAVAANDALHRGKTDAGAGKFGGGMEALEWFEKAVGLARIESGAIVAHIEDGFAVFLGGAEFDGGGIDVAREFPCIAQEILQGNLDEPRIAVDETPGLHDGDDLTLRIGLCKHVENGCNEHAEIEPREMQGGARRAREV